MKKKYIVCCVITFCVLVALLCGFTVPQYPRNKYVTDDSGVLSSEHSTEIVKYSNALKNACGAEIAVLILDTTSGVEPSEFAVETADEWGIGDSEKDNGVLILLATEDREVYVAVGSGLEGRLNDGKVGRIIDRYALGYLREDDFDSGVYSLYKVLLSEVMAEYDIEELEGYQAEPYEEDDVTLWEFVLFFLLIVFLLVSFPFGIYSFFHRNGRGRGGGRWGGGFGGGGFSGGGGFGGGGFSGGGAGRGF